MTITMPNGVITDAFTTVYNYSVATPEQFATNSGSLSFVDHGFWTPYDLFAEWQRVGMTVPNIPTIPANAIFVRREADGMDWYAYARPGDQFSTTPIFALAKLTDRGWQIGRVFIDRSMVIPHEERVIEIRNFNGSLDRIHKNWEGKYYDPVQNKITALAPDHDTLIKFAQDRKKLIEEGGIVVNGYAVATDRASQAMITQTVVSFQLNPNITINWKGPDGNFTILDAATVRGLAMFVITHVANTFDVLAKCIGLIRSNELTTIESVENFLTSKISTTFTT